MKLLIKLAWRNIFRNTRRTILTAIAIGLGLAALIFFDAYMIGMLENMIRAATAPFPGQAQIHKEGFRRAYDVEKTISNTNEIIRDLSHEDIVKAFAPRAMSHAMMTSSSDVSSVMLYGIDPDRERNVSQVSQVIKSGKFLNSNEQNKILIGEKLAKNLDVELGNRIVITVAQANTGELSQEMFRISGIFLFNINEMDTSVAFINVEKAQELLHIGTDVHEIAINFKDIKLASDDTLSFWEKYSKYDSEPLGWNKIFPDIQSIVEMSDFTLWITALILFGMVTIGIMNTLFMSLYDRMFEFGVLRAVGTRPFNMAILVIFEASFLAFISIVIGIIIGFGVSYIYSVTGIDYRGLEFGSVTIRDMIYPVLEYRQFIIYPVLLFIFTTVIAIYPAAFAARITPSKAMRKGSWL